MPLPARVIGLYALATMQGEGSLHGYRLAQRIAERTSGAWRPGAGAVYPALAQLARRGLARSRSDGRRKVYTITPRGRALLRRLRLRRGPDRSTGPDLSVLWAEIAGEEDLERFLLGRLRRALGAIDGVLAAPPSGLGPGKVASLRAKVDGQLRRHLEGAEPRSRRPSRSGPGRRGGRTG